MNLTSHCQHRGFESLVRLASSDSNDIVPVISFNEIPGKGWRCLPELVACGFKRSANAVVCTHLDRVSQINIDEQLTTVSKAFWPKSMKNTARIIPCSSLMGLSAIDLLDKSLSEKPPFRVIWDKKSVGYHVSSSPHPKLLPLTIIECAAKLLGMAEPESIFAQFTNQIWKDKLEDELETSGLPAAIRTLTREILDHARSNAFLSEADAMIRKLRQTSNAQGCVRFPYGASEFCLVCTDDNSLKLDEPRTSTKPQKGSMTRNANSSKECWIP